MKTHLPRPGRNTSKVLPSPSCSARRRYHCIYLYLGWPRKWCRWPMMGSGAYGSVPLRGLAVVSTEPRSPFAPREGCPTDKPDEEDQGGEV
jgi:hypothetical protein